MAVLLDVRIPRTLDAWVTELCRSPIAGTRVEGWLFEGRAARRRAEARLATVGIAARLRSAYKPLVHHFLEEVERAQLTHVTVHCPVHPSASPRRFRLEAYPLAEMLGRATLRFEMQPASDALPAYRIDLQWRDGRQRTDHVLAPNHIHVDALGETLLSPTAWLRVQRPGETSQEGPRESEHQEVFRRAIEGVQQHPWPEAEPYFERLDLRVDLPGIAHAPARESEWMNSREALHEDLYFSLMELFLRRSGRPPGDRRLQPGQIVPDVRAGRGDARLRIVVGPYLAHQPAYAVDDAVSLERSPSPLAPERIAAELARVPGDRFLARTREGRTVHGVHHAGQGPAVLISGAQHANETSGVVGALRAAHQLTAQGAHFALIPVENPDGYALHRTLCAHAPRHMHHAARYTALGDDLEYRDAPPWYEREAREQGLTLSGAQLHLNLHGYPAHEWTRPFSGYIPRGFEAWMLPKGFFLILRHHAGWGDQARALAEHVCRRLAERPALMAFNARQLASYNAHASDLPFELLHGTACMISEVDRPGPPLTLISEFPDETIHGDPFILAHDTQTATVLAAVEALGLISFRP
ncbi:M14 family zinc carboxypeptidase [Variovorax sp. LT1P1]|uniref:M14 family zinc carboxypeptidase n=1 Tax=Variovorax sp. LT1P1 TaxID=3443730 RepID=UPI003F463F34